MIEMQKIEVEGQVIPIEIHRNPRARHMQFRLDSKSGNVKLTLPIEFSKSQGLEFVKGKADWIFTTRAKIIACKVELVEGVEIPLDGCLVPVFFGKAPSLYTDKIIVRPLPYASSDLSMLIQTHARKRLVPLANEKSKILGLPISRLSFRDTRSRWGSCSTSGSISFNWRIVCADSLVQDYLVAHEVAHLKEPHHQPAFWRQCSQLMAQPHALEEARIRLRAIGPKLLALPFG